MLLLLDWGAFGKNKFFKTTDNGSSWDTIFGPVIAENAHMVNIDFRNEMNGAVAIKSQDTTIIYFTSNAGITWNYNDTIIGINHHDFELTPNSGYIAGNPGIFYKMNSTASVGSLTVSDLTIYPNPVLYGQVIQWAQ